MTKITKTNSITNEQGVNAKIEVTATRTAHRETLYCDGWITQSKDIKAQKHDNIKLYINDTLKINTFYKPNKTANKDLLGKGVYAIYDNIAINRRLYDLIMTTYNQAVAEAEQDADYTDCIKRETKQAEIARQDAERYATEQEQLHKSGLCPSCGSWCCGDCQSK